MMLSGYFYVQQDSGMGYHTLHTTQSLTLEEAREARNDLEFFWRESGGRLDITFRIVLCVDDNNFKDESQRIMVVE